MYQDLEDGDTRDLALRIIESDTQKDINSLSWIQFNQVSAEVTNTQ